jgi:hypothetical protein
MKSFGAAVLAVTLFIVSWTIFSGLLAVASLSLGGTETSAGKAMAYVSFVIGTMMAGAVTVYTSGRMMKELSTLNVWLSFAVAAVVVSFVFTAPWYLIKDGIGEGTPEALMAVLVGVPLAIAGGYIGRILIRRRRQREQAELAAQPSNDDKAMAKALADALGDTEPTPSGGSGGDRSA